MPDGRKPPLIVLAGPTASGKSEVGVALAEKLGAQIISADSVQVYRHFDIGAAKPSESLRKRVRHHLLDVADPDEDYSAARFRKEAGRIARDLWSKGRVPLVAGGTGLYIKALVETLHLGARISPEAERRMDEIAAGEGQEGLYSLAVSVDPEWAARIHPNDTFRTRRTVGVYMTTGRRLSEFFRENPAKAEWDTLFLVLDPPRDVLYRRIDRRVEESLRDGWRGEVKRLLEMGYNDRVKPMRSLGYRTLLKEAEGAVDPEESADIIKKETRAFAKRQVTWFRKAEGAVFVPVAEEDTPESIACRILNLDEFSHFTNRHGILVR
ncbi:MAG: tRNA (adenosine(37)-N6)-dimethylallyltransferase MiaA [Candidatus Nitrospinota bacterium M3_3B_026]